MTYEFARHLGVIPTPKRCLQTRSSRFETAAANHGRRIGMQPGKDAQKDSGVAK